MDSCPIQSSLIGLVQQTSPKMHFLGCLPGALAHPEVQGERVKGAPHEHKLQASYFMGSTLGFVKM